MSLKHERPSLALPWWLHTITGDGKRHPVISLTVSCTCSIAAFSQTCLTNEILKMEISGSHSFSMMSWHRRPLQIIAYDVLFMFVGNLASILLGFRDMDNINFSSTSAGGHAYSLAGRYVRLPEWRFLFVFYSNAPPFALRAWTDR